MRKLEKESLMLINYLSLNNLMRYLYIKLFENPKKSENLMIFDIIYLFKKLKFNEMYLNRFVLKYSKAKIKQEKSSLSPYRPGMYNK